VGLCSIIAWRRTSDGIALAEGALRKTSLEEGRMARAMQPVAAWQYYRIRAYVLKANGAGIPISAVCDDSLGA
jgi:hypothetical protein